MIDGSDKLLMEHRDRQVDWAAKRIAELEAENAALKNGGTQAASTNIGSPKLPEYEEVYQGFCAYRGGIGIHESVCEVLEDFYKYIRQLRAGA